MKTFNKCLMFVLVVCMAFSMSACEDQEVAGRYQLVSQTFEERTVTAEEMREILGDVELFLELNDDGTGTMEIYTGIRQLGWDETHIWIAGEEDTRVEYTLENGTITFQMLDVTWVFAK